MSVECRVVHALARRALSGLHPCFATRHTSSVADAVVDSELEPVRAACAQVQTLFWAEGDGLPRPELAQLCGQLSALLDVMALETANLIGNYEQVRWARGVR